MGGKITWFLYKSVLLSYNHHSCLLAALTSSSELFVIAPRVNFYTGKWEIVSLKVM